MPRSPGQDAPWEATGRLVARFHRAGLDHADLNAHNILFDGAGQGWMIDFDRGALRIPATRMARTQPGAPAALAAEVARHVAARPRSKQDFARLRQAYDVHWERG